MLPLAAAGASVVPTLVTALKASPERLELAAAVVDDTATGSIRASVEQRILPLAADRGIGTIIYMPFGRTRLWNRAAGRAVPEWAHEFDAHTWAQFFLKFLAADPRVTLITPATSRAVNMADNLGAAVACRTRRCGGG